MRTAIALIMCILLLIVVFKLGYVQSYDTTYVISTVNITNAGPIISSINVYPSTPINLTEGTFLRVECNVTILDYNGYDDIKYVNATFFQPDNTTYGGALDNNSLYRNASCTLNESLDANTAEFACTFNVMYYANNGTWNCTAFVQDDLGLEANRTSETTIDALYAINVTELIDYGNLSVLDTSLAREVNITNFGNQVLNLTVYGYGGNDPVAGLGWALVCSVGDNITIDNERYALNATNWSSMVSLTNSPVLISNLTIDHQEDDINPVINSTYFRLYVPPNPFGVCNGTVVFEAIAP